MGDGWEPARSRACRHAARKHRRPHHAHARGRAALAAVAGVAAAMWATAGQGLAQGADGTLQMHLAQGSGSDALQITVAPSIAAKAAAQAPLPIAIGPAGALPKNSFVRVRGLPPTISLSEGYVTAPGAWSVPIHALASLQMIVPVGVAGRTDLSISLVAEDGAILAQAKAVLVIEPPPPPPPPKEAKAPATAPRLVSPPAPAAPRAPILSPADREAAERMIARGERESEQGNVAVARQFYLRAAQIGSARAAMLLAATYDPRELARAGVQGVQPNVAEARKWYERARELGAPEAEERLARLGAG
jgi:hypothetical protein